MALNNLKELKPILEIQNDHPIYKPKEALECVLDVMKNIPLDINVKTEC